MLNPGRSQNRHLLDMHLHRHIAALSNEIRKRAADLYFQPFTSVQLEKMGSAFGLSVPEMEKMAVELIQEGRILARVDSTNKVSLIAHVARCSYFAGRHLIWRRLLS